MAKFAPCVVVKLRNFTGEAIDQEFVIVGDLDDMTDRERRRIQAAIHQLYVNIAVGDSITVEASETEVE